MSDWWIDETLPVDPPESPGFNWKLRLDALRAEYLEKLDTHINFLYERVPPFPSPRPHILPKPEVRYEHEDTTKLYPTSRDSWAREYDRKHGRFSQQVRHKRRLTRRR